MFFSSQQRALVAYHRFGLGPRPGDMAAATDPRGALHDEVAHGNDTLVVLPDQVSAAGLGGTSADLQLTFRGSDARHDKQVAEAALADARAFPAGFSETVAEAAQRRIAALRNESGTEGRILRAEALVRLQKACAAPVGFLERLVAFWSNHFCVSVAKGELARATAGSFEREAIRPFVLGRFGDMLVAVERHPAMLSFLENIQSVGPDARGNRNGKRGLNENLAREILELHTLGVDGGYTQADVTAFARVLTGWTVGGRDGRLGEPSAFTFNANVHQPGDETLLGRTYAQAGYGQGEAVLGDLARHPATAHHIATKLVRHFVADDPPAGAVEALARVFLKTDGDLRAVSLALIDLPDAWSAPLTKMRSPYDFVVAAMRLLDKLPAEPGSTMNTLKQLGMPLWAPAGPNGFPDVEAAWASPEGLKMRLDLSAQIAHGYGAERDPLALLDDAFGEAASPETIDAVRRAESKEQAVALLLMSPEFQRR